MLIVFNTAYRPGYLRNVLRTLFLPSGSRNEFRYKVGDDAQVSERQIPSLIVGSEVLICFGDRFAKDGYQFHPFRKGKLQSVVRAGTRVYLTVELGDHVAAKSVENFTELLRTRFTDTAGDGQIPTLTNNDPRSVHDGRYVHDVKPDLNLDSYLDCNEHAWRAASDGLSRCKAFETNEGNQYVFARAELLVNGSLRNYGVEKNGSWYKLERNNDLRLIIYYYYPPQAANVAATAKAILKPSLGMYVFASLEQPLDMEENRLDIPLGLERKSERSFETIGIDFVSTAPGLSVVGPSESLSAKVSDPIIWRSVGYLGMLLYLVGAGFSAADRKIWGETMKGLGIFTMFVALGKKVV